MKACALVPALSSLLLSSCIVATDSGSSYRGTSTGSTALVPTIGLNQTIGYEKGCNEGIR